MSLNGLDSATVTEAHDAAAAAPGGWFLLKYASRDDVEVLDRGTGGIVEIRNAIANYEEPSLLYGFLKYRRRNVILKYEPEECSRLVKVRAVVHFNAICDRFAPYDATFEISTAKELKHTTLSAACSLPTVADSTSSSTESLRGQRLVEIAEEEAEEERERERQAQEEEQHVSAANGAPLGLHDSHQTRSSQDNTFDPNSDLPGFPGAVRPSSPSTSDLGSGRRSLQSARHEHGYGYSSYAYGKPKVRLAPRPSLEANKRPHTASNVGPIATLPQGFKLAKASKKAKQQGATEKEDTEHAEQTALDKLGVSMPEAQDHPEPVLPPRPATSSGASVKSNSSVATSTMSHHRSNPEKARLMKAIKLREQKRKKMSMILDEPVQPDDANADANTNANTNADTDANANSNADARPDAQADAAAAEQHGQEPEKALKAQADDARSISNADSGVVVDMLTPMSENVAHTEDTATDSHPPSPTIDSSEIGDSTKASSVSGSTDETIHQTAQQTKVEDVEKKTTENCEVNELVFNSPLEGEDNIQAPAAENEPTGAPLNPAQAVKSQSGQTREEDPNVSARPEGLTHEESQGIPKETQDILLSTPSTEPDTVGDSVQPAGSPASKKSLEIRTNQIGLSSNDDAPPPKSPYGIPLSKFSSSEQRSPTKSPSTPTVKPRFSIEDLSPGAGPTSTRDSTVLPSPPAPSTTGIEPIEEGEEEPPEKETDRAATETPRPGAGEQLRISSQPDKLQKHRGVEAVKVYVSKGTPSSESTDPLLDDDALMDELQAATVQEAVMVSKSPVSPTFPPNAQKAQSGQETQLSRAVSTPLRGSVLGPAEPRNTARSVSVGSVPQYQDSSRPGSSAGMASKRSTVGSSISQRIKALEQLSSKTVAEEPSKGRVSRPSSTVFSARRSSVREALNTPSLLDGSNPASVPSISDLQRPPSVLERTSSVSTRAASPEQYGERDASVDTLSRAPSTRPGRDRSGSVAKRLSVFEQPGANAPRGRPESVQVTARIIRDPRQQTYPRKSHTRNQSSQTDLSGLELKESPLVVDLKKAATVPSVLPVDDAKAPAEALTEEKGNRLAPDDGDESKKRRPSLGFVKDFIKDRRTSQADALAPQTTGGSISPSRTASLQPSGSSFPRSLSISTHSSVSRDREGHSPLLSPAATLDSGGSGDEERSGDKNSKGRASRFMRRLSSSFGPNRKNATASHSPTVAEEDTADVAASSSAAATSYVGEVNVQFPDNLLWRRRNMSLDTHGFLTLTAQKGSALNAMERIGLKRYHMSEFRSPYAPDVEVQELPNSVVLELVEGSGVQIACENPSGQQTVLHLLQEAYRSHVSTSANH